MLSILSFIPSPSLWSNEILQNSNPIVDISFGCVISSTIPMFADYLVDVFAKSVGKKISPSYHFHLWERFFFLIGYVYPAIGYFILQSFFPSDLGTYFMYLTNSQNVWTAGSLLSLTHTATSEIWTFKTTVIMIVCVGLSSAITPFANTYFSVAIIFYLVSLVYVVIFISSYYRTVLLMRNKGVQNLSSGEYFCLMYSSMLLVMMFVNLIVPSILFGACGPEVALIYSNFANIIAATLVSIIPNRVRQIRLEFTEQSLEMKQSFVRYLSHEMRTPVNIALVGLNIHQQYLIDKNMLDAECNETLSDIKGAIVVALETLNEVLTYEKLYSKVMVLEKSLEEPRAFIVNSLNLFKVSAQNLGIQLILPDFFQYPNSLSMPMDLQNKRIDVDVHKMGQVLRNFVSNAMKFTPSGGTVRVDMRIGDLKSLQSDHGKPTKKSSQEWVDSMFFQEVPSTTEWIEISVTDTGVGIAPENLHRVFNEIIQFNPNQNQGGNGSGLGMYISKGIAELHGGSVGVQSDGLNKGTRFCVWLPLTSAPPNQEIITIYSRDADSMNTREGQEESSEYYPVPVRKRSVLSVLVKSNSTMHFKDMNRVHPEGDEQNSCMSELLAPPRMQHVKGKKETLVGLKMLMVDDSATNLKLCVKLFTRLGADVDSASDGSIAVEMVRARMEMTISAAADEDNDIESNVAKDRQYDIIVMDNLMPVMGGMEAAKEMRRSGFNQLIIGITGQILDEDMNSFIRAGADLVLGKPLQCRSLKLLLHHIQQHGTESRTGMRLVLESQAFVWKTL
mmetsp:Transcript_3598/g.5099  ORF Transcript_3598/g.5099 Transcript_3598/m.5099 type:complete len:787 (-) Transcript_3598:22-2382(-)